MRAPGLVCMIGIAASGCLKPDLRICGDYACPIGTACRPNGAGCVPAAQIVACEGLAAAAPCSVGAIEGECVDGVCEARACGNGVITTDEVCDDGNAASADGCSSDCRSTEVCGDGIRSEAVDEACDDGNTASADGCSATCQREELHFKLVASSGPSPRCWAAMAYDPVLQGVLLFGGDDCGSTYYNDTWLWNGTAWTLLGVAGPSHRSEAAVATDLARGEVILFGGKDAGSDLDDTWRWNGSAWSLLTPAGAPPATAQASLVFDVEQAGLVLFGGTSGELAWRWNGASWAQVPRAATEPRDRRGHYAAYDPVEQSMLIYGGRSNAGSYHGDLWALRGDTWTMLFDDDTETRAFGVMTYHVGQKAIVRQSGYVYSSNVETTTSVTSTTWSLAGTTWTGAAFFPQPSPRNDLAAAYDPIRATWVLFGGANGSGTPFGDTWTYGYVLP